MELAIHNNANAITAKISGQFTFGDNQKFKHILELAAIPELRAVRLDFTDVTFIDSAGLGMLLLLRDKCQDRHIPVTILSPQGQVEKVLMISKFDQLFSIQPSSQA